MRKFPKIALGLLFVVTHQNLIAVGPNSNWNEQLKSWRTEHAVALSAPDGWLSLVGLEWLRPGDNTFGTAPGDRIQFKAKVNEHFGILHVEQGKVHLQAPAGGFPADLHVDGQPAAAQDLVVDGAKPTTFTVGTLTFYAIHRGNDEALRIKDSESPTRVHFRGLKWFPADPSYRIEAEWVPFAEPKHVTVESVAGTSSSGLIPGYAKFTLHGHEIQLQPVVQNLDVKTLLFVVRDATSGKETYAASRFLHSGLPDHGLRDAGKITLDFNRLENPPCAFTPYATCPLPPENNRLKVAINAGELRYAHDSE